MKTITCWNDLKAFGIDLLTGESCGLSCRILFDCTERGRLILGRMFGIPNLQLSPPWNQGEPGDRHVGSILLTPDMLTLVSIFALLESGCDEAWSFKGGVIGFEAGDAPEYRNVRLRSHGDTVGRRYAYAGTAGDRNRHVFSGRIE